MYGNGLLKDPQYKKRKKVIALLFVGCYVLHRKLRWSHKRKVRDKMHYVSFIAYVTSDSFEIKKLYPEQEISVRFRKKGHGMIYAYCNRHGMFFIRI